MRCSVYISACLSYGDWLVDSSTDNLTGTDPQFVLGLVEFFLFIQF